MRSLRLCFSGFGAVGQRFAKLLLERKDELETQYNLYITVTGISTPSRGTLINPHGLNLAVLLAQQETHHALPRPRAGRGPAPHRRVHRRTRRTGQGNQIENTVKGSDPPMYPRLLIDSNLAEKNASVVRQICLDNNIRPMAVIKGFNALPALVDAIIAVVEDVYGKRA